MINKLEICGLTKRFGKKTLFEDLDLTLAEPAILWAPSGWGKTTLLRILMGLEAPDSGTVQGVGRVGAVFQEDRLCPQLTAVQNVELVFPEGKTQYKTQIVSDFQRFGYDEQALALPARKLSGGQKQRISLARALAVEPSILILDDTTSAVDMETEKQIQQSLKELDFTCTKIIIAQRISTTKEADHIFVMQNGYIKEAGTHEELIAKKGYYYDLVRLQTGLEEL